MEKKLEEGGQLAVFLNNSRKSIVLSTFLSIFASNKQLCTTDTIELSKEIVTYLFII